MWLYPVAVLSGGRGRQNRLRFVGKSGAGSKGRMQNVKMDK